MRIRPGILQVPRCGESSRRIVILFIGREADSFPQCEEVAGVLRNKGVNAQAFHAQLPEHKREERLHAWKAGEIECIVATIAFGMVGPWCQLDTSTC